MKIGYSKTNKWFRSNPYGKKERVQETEEGSEKHRFELQSRVSIWYTVFSLKKKKYRKPL
jgi:hypothetical protein